MKIESQLYNIFISILPVLLKIVKINKNIIKNIYSLKYRELKYLPDIKFSFIIQDIYYVLQDNTNNKIDIVDDDSLSVFKHFVSEGKILLDNGLPFICYSGFLNNLKRKNIDMSIEKEKGEYDKFISRINYKYRKLLTLKNGFICYKCGKRSKDFHRSLECPF